MDDRFRTLLANMDGTMDSTCTQEAWALAWANRGFVYKKAIAYARSPTDKEDLFQFGLLALFRSAKNYKPGTGVSLINYCGPTVQADMYKEARRLRCRLKIPFDAPKPQFTEEYRSAFQVKPLSRHHDACAPSPKEHPAKKVVGVRNRTAAQVCKLVIEGRSRMEIAEILSISERSVSNHIRNLTNHYTGKASI